ncbi:MAG: hypothetical protein ABIH72_04240 [archaeon]
MDWIKLNSAVSYYEKPALGKVNPKTRYMALSIDKSTLKNKLKIGIAREITKSQGNVDIPGFIDESKLVIVSSSDLMSWKKVNDLKIKNIDRIIAKISSKDKYFIGLEDPDIWQEGKIKHVYFTIAFKYKSEHGYAVYLGHAQGKSIESLTATLPVLQPIKSEKIDGFKEVAISPIKTKEGRFILSEVEIKMKNNDWSAIAVSKASKMSGKWQFLKILLNPHELKYNWCKGHLSPCCFLSSSSSPNNNLLVGIINGRQPSKIINNKKIYRKFRPGLILFNPHTGEIPWISPTPLFEDPQATTITFASDFIELSSNKGLLYCHVNDSFIRAYKLNLKEIKKCLLNSL